jgi:tripartite-type tricarboxylate transporter receptor subunit TctC
MNIMAENTSFLRQAGFLPKLLGATALVFGVAAYGVPAPAADFDAAKHFKGKTIRMIVDFKPGGGTDLQARYFAGNWAKFLPGNPRIKVSNLCPNPSGRNFVWKSKPDGLTLNFVASAGVGTELVDKTAKFEIAKFIQIGSHAKRDVVLLARGTVPYNSIPEARGSKVKLILAEPIGSPADLDGKLLATGMLSMWFDVPLKIATVARSGTADTLLMLERGDVNGYIAGSHWYALPKLRPGWFKKGYLKPIADMGHPGAPSIPNSEIKMPLPNAMTWLNDEQKALWKGIFLPEVISGKGITAPPGTPDAIVKVLRAAYAKALHDPKFSSGLVRIQRQPVAFIGGEKMQKLVTEGTEAFKKQLPNFKEVRQQVYNRYFKGLKIVKIPEKFSGKITKIARGGRLIVVKGHGVKISGSRSEITIKGQNAKRKALKAGMTCSINGKKRKGKYEAKQVACK